MNIYEKTRLGKNPCPKCNKPMGMYYKPWCPICDKPKIKNIPVLNFVQCLDHLEAIGNTGIKDRIWSRYSYDFHNDTMSYLHFPDESERSEYASQHLADIDLIRETWNINDDSIAMWVSW